jgi:hypothetical protein
VQSKGGLIVNNNEIAIAGEFRVRRQQRRAELSRRSHQQKPGAVVRPGTIGTIPEFQFPE